jgi:hypothetical protein
MAAFGIEIFFAIGDGAGLIIGGGLGVGLETSLSVGVEVIAGVGIVVAVGVNVIGGSGVVLGVDVFPGTTPCRERGPGLIGRTGSKCWV